MNFYFQPHEVLCRCHLGNYGGRPPPYAWGDRCGSECFACKQTYFYLLRGSKLTQYAGQKNIFLPTTGWKTWKWERASRPRSLVQMIFIKSARKVLSGRHFVRTVLRVVISWAYLGHILGICSAYLRHSQAYLGHISGISRAYPGHILGISWECLGHILCISRAYLGYILSIS